MRLLAAFVIGTIFGVGIMISGMINPAKVLNFFDLAGSWDPSLAFVMGGALLVAIPGYRLVWRRSGPIFDTAFHMPTKRDLDKRLIGGSAVFGIGWGIAGFCPGGALPAIGTLRADVLVFIAALIAGILLARMLQGMVPPAHTMAEPETERS